MRENAQGKLAPANAEPAVYRCGPVPEVRFLPFQAINIGKEMDAPS